MTDATHHEGEERPMRLRLRRRPIEGPPLPECGAEGFYSWERCDLTLHHEGDHGRVIGRSSHAGVLVASTSVTRSMWKRKSWETTPTNGSQSPHQRGQNWMDEVGNSVPVCAECGLSWPCPSAPTNGRSNGATDG